MTCLSSFQAIENKEGEQQGAQLQYTCRCSFLQIYNEQISDLLLPGDKPLQLRFDNNTGVYVEGLSEQVVVNGAFFQGHEVGGIPLDT